MTPWILLLALSASPIEAPLDDPADAPHEAHDETRRAHHPHNLAGLKMVAAAVPTHAGIEVLSGPGVIVEREILPGLELELDVLALMGKDHQEFPVDVLLKHAFHLQRSLDVFIGAGPAASIGLQHGASHFHAGLLASAGTYWWLAGDLGFIVELDYGVYAGEELLHEAELSTGVAWRF